MIRRKQSEIGVEGIFQPGQVTGYELTTARQKRLDKASGRFTIPKNSGAILPLNEVHLRDDPDNMTAKPPVPPSNVNTKQPCKHPRVQIVSRDEESEFVECKECGEIFESSEFKDMNIEELSQDPEI
jgi:hypothetical protein